jgi:hypothetical protein
MNAQQINRHRTGKLSPKEALRAHIDQLSLEKQREFIAAALQLIIARPTLCEVEIPAYQPVPARKRIVIH